MIGSTECGKTTFAKNVLIPQLQYELSDKNYISNVQYLSSDNIRQELLGYPYDKYDSVMTEASEQAFELLFKKLKAVTRFPINADFVIIDTTGLSEDFRKRVSEIAQDHHYRLEAIIFDYKNMRDYYASERSKKLIANHVNRLRKDVLPSIRRSDYDNIHRIREKNFYDSEKAERNPDYIVEVEDREEYVTHLLPPNFRYVVIGDVHECVAELKALITSNGFEVIENKIQGTSKNTNKYFVLVGDFIDKGKNTKETIEFLYENRHFFYFTKGNHENFVSKYLKGEINEKELDLSFIETYFDSIQVLRDDRDLQTKFQEIVDLSRDFYRYIGKENDSFYVTHAPCFNQYIGKLDSLSTKRQRRFSTEFEGSIEAQLKFLETEGATSYPYHIFGHVATREVIRLKNKIGIDTGCVSGNRLSSVTLGGFKLIFKSVPANPSIEKGELQLAFSNKLKEINVQDLSDSDQKRLHYILRNKVNFISGTISPADKSLRKNELESLSQGLYYFKNHGVKEVILQPKYMGSRCNLYLSRDLEKCYATSRNGYKITQVDLDDIYQRLLDKFLPMMEEDKIETILFDGELLPWNALGKGLIQQQFEVVAKSLESEIDFLKEFRFEENFNSLRNRYEESGFDGVNSRLSKKQLIEKFGQTDYNNFKDFKAILETYHPLEEHEKAYLVYQKQLELYGKDSELEYKPFSILKIVYQNGKEEIPSSKQSELFYQISDDEFVVISLEEADSFEKAEAFFNKLTMERGMEGVVIKPENPASDLIPFIKVRNPEYLTLVYGYDYRFEHKYEKLIKQKNIKRKVQASLSEYKLGLEMLGYRLDEIEPNHSAFKQVVANLLFEESKEAEIDPRL
jgi:predicted kinase